MKRAVLLLAVFASCVAVGIFGARGVSAQQFDPTYNPNTTFDPNNVEADSFDRGQNVSVRERPRPDYQAQGVHVGGFTVYPKVVLSLNYDDNVFATQHNTVSDWFGVISPEVDIQSNWSRNALAAYIRGSQSFYFSQTTESTTQWGAGINGKYEFGGGAFGNGTLTAALDYGRYTLPREAANLGQSSEHPIQYDFVDLDGELADTINRLRLSLRGDYQLYDYLNARTPNGIFIFEAALNHSVATVTGKAEYALSPNSALFVALAYNDRVYFHQPPVVPFDNDNHGYNVSGGVNFDLTHLIRGEIQLGYMDQQYVGSVYRTISGLSAKGQLEWFPTQLTTVTFTALRTVGDSGLLHSAGYRNTTGAVQIDHELLRNLILSANASATENIYNGIIRNDHIWSAGASADWLVNRWAGLSLAYLRLDQNSSGAGRGPSFVDDRLVLSLVLQR